MAKKSAVKQISYSELLKFIPKTFDRGALYIQMPHPLLFDEMVEHTGKIFIGENFNKSNDLIVYQSDEKRFEVVTDELSGIGLFGDKKIIVIKNPAKLVKDELKSLEQCLKNPSPDTYVMLHSEGDATPPEFIMSYAVSEFTPDEFLKFVRAKFDGFEISDNTIMHLVQTKDFNIDDILSETEKLKTYCWSDKKITDEAINLCIGISKDFREHDFVKAILERDAGLALGIYDKLMQKKDVEIYLLILLSSAMSSVSKLRDPGINSMNPFQLKSTLKIWSNFEEVLTVYKKYASVTDRHKLAHSFEAIYEAEKCLKTSQSDKRTIFTGLIRRLTIQ